MAVSSVYRPVVLTLIDPGTLTVATNPTGAVVPFDGRIVAVHATVDTAPTGAALQFDLHVNGTDATDATIQIPISGTEVTADIDLEVEAGDKLAIDVSVIGSSVAGSNLVVAVVIEP